MEATLILGINLINCYTSYLIFWDSWEIKELVYQFIIFAFAKMQMPYFRVTYSMQYVTINSDLGTNTTQNIPIDTCGNTNFDYNR